jgi:acyl carrier protein
MIAALNAVGVALEHLATDRDLAAEYGVDSLDLVGLAIAVQERFCVVLRDEELAGARTIEDLAALVTRGR